MYRASLEASSVGCGPPTDEFGVSSDARHYETIVVVLGDALLIGAVWTYWFRGVHAKLEVLEIPAPPRHLAAEKTDASLAGDWGGVW
jgi:hypothetical protein